MSASSNAGLAVKTAVVPTRILLIARRDLFVDGIIRILESIGSSIDVTCVAPGEPCAGHFAANYPDLLLLQENAKRGPIEDFIQEMIEGFPGLRLLMFGQQMSDDYLYRVVRAGAHGYINEKMNGAHMADALNTVLDGRYWVERHIMERFIADRSMVDGVYTRVREMGGRLTTRESEVLELIIEGLSTSEIAERVFLSHQGVKAHLTTLFRKFEVKNRSQLILAALNEVSPIENITGLMQQGLQADRFAAAQLRRGA